MRFQTDSDLVIKQDVVLLDFVKGEYSHNFDISRPYDANTIPGLGTTYNAQGEIEVCAQNTLRIMHDPITKECLGVVVESELQNYASTPEFWGRDTAKTSNDIFAAVTANTNLAMYESPELNIDTLATAHGVYRGLGYADVWLSGTSNTSANLNLMLHNSLGNIQNPTWEIDGTAGYVPAIANLTYNCSSNAFTYDWKGHLTQVKVNQPRYIYDVTNPLNLVANPWGDGGVPGTTTLPPHYNAIGGGLTAQFVGRGQYEDGLQYTEWLISGVSNGVAQNLAMGCRGWPSSTPLMIQADPGIGVWSGSAFVEILENNNSFGSGTNITFWLGSLNSAGSVINSNGWQISIPRQVYNVRTRYEITNRSLTNTNTAGAEIAFRLLPSASEVVYLRFRICAPILSCTSTQLTSIASIYDIMARKPVDITRIGNLVSPNTPMTNNTVWNNVGMTVTSTNTVFQGEDVYQCMETATSSAKRIELIGPGLINATINYTYTTVFYIKPINLNYFNLSTTSGAGSASILTKFSFDGEVVSAAQTSRTPFFDIKPISDGWFQVIWSAQAILSSTLGILIGSAPEKNTGRTDSFTGDTARGFYITTPKIYDDFTVYPYAMETPQYGLLGMLIEEPVATNLFVNPNYEGGSNGVHGNTAVLPNTVSLFYDANLTCTFTTVQDCGMNCIDLNFSGIPSTNSQLGIRLGQDIPANTSTNHNQIVTAAYIRTIVAANATPAVLRILESNANTYTAYDIPLSVDTTATAKPISNYRVSMGKTIDNANTTAARIQIVANTVGGAVVNTTFRIAAPMVEKSAYNSFTVLPPAGTQVAATKARNIFTSSGVYLSDGITGSMAVRLSYPFYNLQTASALTWTQRVAVWIGPGNSDSNCIRLMGVSNSSRPGYHKVVNSVTPVNIIKAANTRDILFSSCITWSPQKAIVAFESNTPEVTYDNTPGDPYTTPLTNLRFDFGQTQGGGQNIILNKFRLWDGVAMSNVQVIAQANRIT